MHEKNNNKNTNNYYNDNNKVVFDTKLEQLSLTPSPNSHACLNIYLTEKYFFKSNYIHIHKKNNKTLINIVTSYSNQNFKRYIPVQYKQTRV